VNGTVGHVLIDVAGYNVPGGTGVQGIPGDNGTNGAVGVPVRRYGRTITSLSTGDNTDTVGFDTSITIGTNANPIISYHDITNSALNGAKLTRTSWTPNTWEAEPKEPGRYGNRQGNLSVAPPCAASARRQQRAC
jgi:hypothetical protein